jgi:hypothetical protein
MLGVDILKRVKQMRATSIVRILAVTAGLAVAAAGWAGSPEQKPGREEGQFRITVGGKEIGSEKYVITASDDSAGSSSIVEFQNPGEGRQKVRFETRLEMDSRYRPRNYELRSDVSGQKGTILGKFAPNQAIFEYQGAPAARKNGLLVGEQYTLLDTNVFHHFVFLARLFDFNSKEKIQRFEVVIPQESDSGVLKVSELNRERVSVRGKKIETHHLQADSGSLLVQLWIDEEHVLYKIAVKDKGIEVIRNP